MGKMREVIMYLEEDTNNICTKNGSVLWYDFSGHTDFKDLEFACREDLASKKESNKPSIEDLVRLKTAGFDAEDIILMNGEKIL